MNGYKIDAESTKIELIAETTEKLIFKVSVNDNNIIGFVGTQKISLEDLGKIEGFEYTPMNVIYDG